MMNSIVAPLNPADNHPPAMLRLRDLERQRAGRTVVHRLSLDLRRGEVLGLLGINGAGKSTTLAMIATALAPDQGMITLDGHELTEHPEQARRLIGWLPERAPLWSELTVHEHLRTHGRLRGLAGKVLEQAIDSVLQRLSLSELSRRLAAVLSQGQRQRLGLACALLHRPALLVLDEPANALDPVQVVALRRIIREEAANGSAVILSTHVLSEVTAVCDRVAIMHGGTLHYDAPLEADHHALERRFFTIAQQPTARGKAAA